MQTDTAQGEWTQLKGKIREKWGKLKSEDLDALEADVIKGKGEQLAGKIQAAYGTAKEKAQDEIGKLKNACNC